MSEEIRVGRANTVLYCERWAECVDFYRSIIGFAVEHENDWFVEFHIVGDSFLSVANAARATIPSARGGGLTLTWMVDSVAAARDRLTARGVAVTPLTTRWGSTVCYCHDPEGNRIELWQASVS